MVIKHLELLNELGLHARVASRIVREAKKFTCSIISKKDDRDHDFKNVTGVITVNAKRGDILTIEFEGEDEGIAAAALEELFQNKFGER